MPIVVVQLVTDVEFHEPLGRNAPHGVPADHSTAGQLLADVRHTADIQTCCIERIGVNVKPTSGFVNIPLQMRNRYGLAALATIITAAPGTYWAAYDTRSGVLTIHVLDLVDESHWLKTIKWRYEGLLMEIFE